MELRPYQQDLINDIRKELATGLKRVCAVLGCGGGKSFIQANIAKLANDKENRVLYLIHRKELASQIQATFYSTGVNPELCDIMMVQTASRRIKKITKPALIIVDEAHHILSNSYLRILDAFSDVPVVGFTATPARMNEGGLGKVFQKLIISVPTKWLIEKGYLAKYKMYGVPLVSTKGLHSRLGDYRPEEVEQLMSDGAVFGGTVRNWENLAKGKKTIVYCSSVATSKLTAETFCQHGYVAKHLDGTTPTQERDAAVQDFRDGKIQILCNVDLFGEGFDVPDCEAVVLLRPTQSLTLYIQQSMRSMRADPNNPDKVALILDHVGNYTRHGLPDADRDWSLEQKKKKSSDDAPVKTCKNCLCVMPASATECPFCGFVFEQKQRKEKKFVELDLVEITDSNFTLREIKQMRYRDLKLLHTWNELDAYRRTHKTQAGKTYSIGWALHQAVELGIKPPSKYYYQMKMMRLI